MLVGVQYEMIPWKLTNLLHVVHVLVYHVLVDSMALRFLATNQKQNIAIFVIESEHQKQHGGTVGALEN